MEINTKGVVRSIKAFFLIFYLVKKIKNKIKVVHCHLAEATIYGSIFYFALNIKNKIVTIHNNSFDKFNIIKFPLIVLFYNLFYDKLIFTCKSSKDFYLKKKIIISKKIYILNHGFNISKDYNLEKKKISLLRRKYKIKKNLFVIGSVSRFLDWKGVIYTVKAFKKLKKLHSNSLLILTNAFGNYEHKIIKEIQTLPEKSYVLINFENDMRYLYKIFNCLVHVPISKYSETFGQVYIEAMYSKVPTIFTPSGVISEIGKHKQNTYLVNFSQSDQILKGIKFYIKNTNKKKIIINNAYNLVEKKFTIEKHVLKLIDIYNK